MATRWGIASAGLISHDFVCSLKTQSKDEHQVVAVAARSQKSADEFAKRHNIPTALQGYEALAKLPNIDIVYIGTINTNHVEVSKLMLDNGKHVLCEKPLTVNKKLSAELLAYAKSKNLFFMEALWSRCFPIYQELRKQLDSGIIGKVMQINIAFGFPIDNVERVNSKELGGGTILDIGIYPMQFTNFVFQGLKPVKFVGSGNLNKNGVDETASAIIHYPENRTAVLTVTSYVNMPNEAIIVGTKGFIKVPMFWCPNTIITPEKTIKIDFPKSDEKYFFNNSVGLVYEAIESRRCIKAGLLESPFVPHSLSLEIAELLDTWRKEVGTVYDEDLL